MNYHYQNNERFGGLLLPFLAGVAVTTPFVFLNKQQPYPYYPAPPPPPYYPMPYPYPRPIFYGY